jgi:hypothetical protein
MLKRLSQAEKFEQLISKFEPPIQRAFMEAVADLRDGISITALVRALERNDIEGAILALNLDRAAYNPLVDAIAAAYQGGGKSTADGMVALPDNGGGQAVIRFDGQHARAMAWLIENGAQLVTNLTEDTRMAVRTTVSQGIAAGRGARAVGLDIAGRINPATGRRTGGIVGLSAPQAGYVASMRQRLASGDPVEMGKVLDMTRRDRRLDKAIRTAIAAGRPVNARTIDLMTARYSDRLLELRATTIARTEGMKAFNVAAMEAYRQTIDRGAVQEADLTKIWRSAGDRRTRDTHRIMHGQETSFNGSFQSPSGVLLRYPHDENAPPSETVNCRCRMDITVDYLARFRRVKR